jgi:hypothetical protein
MQVTSWCKPAVAGIDSFLPAQEVISIPPPDRPADHNGGSRVRRHTAHAPLDPPLEVPAVQQLSRERVKPDRDARLPELIQMI